MTDKQLVETLKNIKKNCAKYGTCYKCKFFTDVLIHDSTCQLIQLVRQMNRNPQHWNMEEIERIVKQ